MAVTDSSVSVDTGALVVARAAGVTGREPAREAAPASGEDAEETARSGDAAGFPGASRWPTYPLAKPAAHKLAIRKTGEVFTTNDHEQLNSMGRVKVNPPACPSFRTNV